MIFISKLVNCFLNLLFNIFLDFTQCSSFFISQTIPSGIIVTQITGYYKNKQCKQKATVKWPLTEISTSHRQSLNLQNKTTLKF